MNEASLAVKRAEKIRAFNRFYTGQMELLDERLHHSDFTLTETRILFELAARRTVVANDLVRDLRIDAGYLSRILGKFGGEGLIERTPASHDGRQMELSLTAKGLACFRPLDDAARAQIIERLKLLSDREQRELVGAMGRIEALFGRDTATRGAPILRELQPGDIGWITHRQGVLYHEEYGWDVSYEALVANILGDFGIGREKARERAWIAELDGRVVGSVFLMKASEDLAKLRLLYVEPDTRGMGLGRQLVEACVSSARECGYKRMTLWTQSILTGARRIYTQVGFTKTAEEAHHSFGHDLVGETWEMNL
jgi:DNA-binding MarR family transcriptional regulator/GNAT superfamily N-acetyltransferase